MKITSLIILLFVLCFVSVSAAEFEKIDGYVETSMARQKIPGVAVAIVEGGRIKYAKGFGYANVEHKVPVTVDTIFQTGSVGKQFTAAAVMLLAEEGKLGYDDPVSKHIAGTPSTWSGITIRHLLTHTSGLGDYPEGFDYRKDYTEKDLMAIVTKSKLSFQPGEKWSYSNFGYVTLGILIREVSGKYFGDFLKDRVFGPAGMKTARVISESDIVPNRAAGYVLRDGILQNQNWVAPSLNTTADGALYMTLKDMARWDAALYKGGLFKPATLEEAWRPIPLTNGKTFGYGFGWSLDEVPGGKVVEHGGSWQGFKAHISRFLDAKTTVIVFANLAQADTSSLARGIASRIDPKLGKPKQSAIEDKDPTVTKLFRKVLADTATGKPDKEDFTDEAKEKLYPFLVQGAGFIKSLGEIEKIELLESGNESGFKRYKYRVTFGAAEKEFVMVLDSAGKIAGMAILN